MNLNHKLERSITFLPAGERPPPPIAYWSTRPYHERLVEVFTIVSAGSAANLERFHKALDAFGIELTDEGKAHFLTGNHFWIGKPPWAIDFVGNPTGIEFEACYEAREETDLEGIRIPFLSKEHFIQNKLAIGRPQDIADVDHINHVA